MLSSLPTEVPPRFPSDSNSALSRALAAAIDAKTKPLGALGRIEELALQLGRVQHTLTPRVERPAVVVFAGDHGATRTPGLSAYPRDVTWQMALNFLAGGAAINVFARTLALEVVVVDAGVDHVFEPHPQLVNAKVARGTRSWFDGPAMDTSELAVAFGHAERIVDEQARLGTNVLALGEMGIGNTASAALITHALLRAPLRDVVGRGTGLDDAGLAHKRKLLERAALLHGLPDDPRDVLCCYGGFEIAMLAQAIVAGASRGMLVLVDGFIVTAAALVAARLEPRALAACVFAHRSQESGHRVQLEALGVRPLLDLDLRLGEGTGAALAVPLVRAAAAMLCDMASFASAKVDGPAERS